MAAHAKGHTGLTTGIPSPLTELPSGVSSPQHKEKQSVTDIFRASQENTVCMPTSPRNSNLPELPAGASSQVTALTDQLHELERKLQADLEADEMIKQYAGSELLEEINLQAYNAHRTNQFFLGEYLVDCRCMRPSALNRKITEKNVESLVGQFAKEGVNYSVAANIMLCVLDDESVETAGELHEVPSTIPNYSPAPGEAEFLPMLHPSFTMQVIGGQHRLLAIMKYAKQPMWRVRLFKNCECKAMMRTKRCDLTV
jgi:hypothetical protein